MLFLPVWYAQVTHRKLWRCWQSNSPSHISLSPIKVCQSDCPPRMKKVISYMIVHSSQPIRVLPYNWLETTVRFTRDVILSWTVAWGLVLYKMTISHILHIPQKTDTLAGQVGLFDECATLHGRTFPTPMESMKIFNIWKKIAATHFHNGHILKEVIHPI